MLDVKNMNRDELIQYITLILNYFYNKYESLTEEERKYLKEYIEILDKVYTL